MATNSETQITWSGSNSVSVASGGSETSDVITPSGGSVQATVLLKANHDSTPADGDEIEFVFQYTIGDPDGAAGDEYTTEEHSYSVIADTFLEDPALLLIELPQPLKAFQLKANNNGASAITVSATLYDQVA